VDMEGDIAWWLLEPGRHSIELCQEREGTYITADRVEILVVP